MSLPVRAIMWNGRVVEEPLQAYARLPKCFQMARSLGIGLENITALVKRAEAAGAVTWSIKSASQLRHCWQKRFRRLTEPAPPN
jgi:hypothetical protein